MSGKDAGGSGNIQVVCRVRPFNKSELEMGSVPCVEFIDQQSIRIKLTNTDGKDKADNKQLFNFDRVFNMEATQQQIYEVGAKPVVQSVLEGFNGTVFAYGQTSSGKTFTMQGASIDDEKLKGVIPRMVKTVFEHISDAPDHIEFRIKISIVEIYMEKIRDLLDNTKQNLVVREDKQRGIYIQDVTEQYVSTEQDVYDLLRIGNQNRAVTATNMNEGSSRSHMLFMMTVSQNNLNDLSAKTGKLFLVDLAGSEKISKTGAEGRVLDEAKTINQSLSSLGNVINALTDGKSSHIPYRNSKLTRVLQESIGGNSRTTLIITCSPSPFNDLETLSTLRFGIRAKAIKNKAKVNREVTVAELQVLIAKIEKQLDEKTKRIKQLEDYIQQQGSQLPSESSLQIQDDQGIAADSQEEITSTQLSNIEEIVHPKMSEEELKFQQNLQEQVTQLQEVLDIEKNNVTVQTEKLSILRKEFTKITAKCMTLEKENENLVQRLANFNLQLSEERHVNEIKDKELEQINEENQKQREKLIKEIDNLKQIKDNLQQKLDDQIDKIEEYEKKDSQKKAQFFLEEQKEAEQYIIELKNENKMLRENQKKKDEFIEQLMQMDSISGDVKELVSSFKKSQVEVTQPEGEIFQDLKNKISFLETQLLGEKRYGQDLQKQIRNFRKEKENMVQEFKMEIEKEQVKYSQKLDEVKKDNEKKLVKLTEDLQNRVDKVVELEIKLDEIRDQNAKLQEFITSDEKQKLKKIMTLETSMQDLTRLYYEQQSLQQNWKMDSQVTDNKISRKNDRIIDLENELSKTKDELISTKAKMESLKKHLTASVGVATLERLKSGTPLNSMQKSPISSASNFSERVQAEEQEGNKITSKDNLGNNLKMIQELNFSNNLIQPTKVVKPLRGGNQKTSQQTTFQLEELKFN